MKKHLVYIGLCFLTTIVYGQSLQLQMPIHNSQNTPSIPLFSWNLIPSSSVQHVFTIAEYNSGQANQTTLDNNPYYSQTITSSSSFLTYLYNGTILFNCTEYIWQVKTYTITYTNDEPPVPIYTYQTQSGINQFKTSGCTEEEEEESSTPDANYYIVPYKQIDHFVYVIHEDTLRIKYQERYNNTEIQYRIYTNKNDTFLQGDKTVVPGLNYLSISLPSTEIEESPVIYTIELQAPKGDVLKLKFEKKTL